MNGKGLFRIGAAGAIVTAICCVTPFLPFVLGALGLGGAIGYVYTDALLYPLLAGFLFIAGLGIWLRKQSN